MFLYFVRNTRLGIVTAMHISQTDHRRFWDKSVEPGAYRIVYMAFQIS